MSTSQKYLAPTGRLLTSAVFIFSAIDKLLHREKNLEYIRSAMKTPRVSPLLSAAVAAEFLAGIALVIGGRTSRAGAAILAAYLVPTTLLFHRSDQVGLLKNLSIIGGLLHIAATPEAKRPNAAASINASRHTTTLPESIEIIEIDERTAS